MRKLKIGLFVLLICACVLSPSMVVKADVTEPTTAAHGSGSYQLNSVPTEYRFYTEYFVKADTNKSITSAGIDRRTSIKVYAKAGEIILFGSSVYNSQIDADNQFTGAVTGADIVITTPDGSSKIPFNVLAPGETEDGGTVRPNGLGYIQGPAQEMNGPMVNHDDQNHPESYYVPLQYPVTQEGVYTFEFHSVTGFNPNSAPSGYHPSPKKAGDTWAQGNTSVAAWDVTVLGEKSATEWEVKSGRAWADYIALTTAGSVVNGQIVKSDLNVHVLSHDGYQYRVNFKEAAPYGFIFFANNTGFMASTTDTDSNTTSYHPIYHSFYDASNDLDGMTSQEKIYLHKPDEQDTDTEETYKIFFNAPNDDLNGIEYTKYTKNDAVGKTDKIKTSPELAVNIQDLKFTGISENISRTGHGGYFTFHSSGEAMVTIRLDLRKAIYESEGTMDTYNGSGFVEITTPAVKTTMDPTDTADLNRVYWDGKDTDGITIPAGLYGDNNVVISTEIKRGELHFPVIDMEGLYEGLTVERINGYDADLLTDKRYDLYYNNNPLAYGSIEGLGFSTQSSGSYFVMTDGTRSYKVYSDTALRRYFTGGPSSITTLKKDDKEYLASKLFATPYASLDAVSKSIIDAEFETELPTFHHEAVNSNLSTGWMLFNAENYDGGGNKAGIDAWTYYSSGVGSSTMSFAVMDTENRGMIRGQVFYDALDAGGHPDSVYTPGSDDYLLSGIKVRLIDANGDPLIHQESVPCFDDTGHFKYDENGKIVFEQKDVAFESITDATGTYRFTSVPYSSTEDTTYYVQVMLTDVQSEVLRYTCTTSNNIKSKFVDDGGVEFLPATINLGVYGADGNVITEAKDELGNWDALKKYKHMYARINNDDKNETVFVKDQRTDSDYAQSVTFATTDPVVPGEIIRTKEFKMIGYSSTVPDANRKDLKVAKSWGTDSQGNIHKISDGLIVELYVWNDSKVEEENTHDLTRRTGALVDTQVLNEANGWNYTWYNLDDRLQYYVLEYYTKKKDNGEVIYNDKGEPRKVLIGGTMPIFGAASSVPASNIYGFDTYVGKYPETILVNGIPKIPIQQFGDGVLHHNALTENEQLESVDNNARRYNVTYTLTKENSDKRNVITLNNSQVYDDRAYYVWLDHEAELPEMIALTYVEPVAGSSVKVSHTVPLMKDKQLEDGTFTIKGLSVSSIDAAAGNSEGNSTESFRVRTDGGNNAFFTPTNTASYKTGTGTRTYQVKYVVRKSDNTPVSVTAVSSTDLSGKTTIDLVETGTSKKVEELTTDYIVDSWYMTIHVYDLKPDGPIIYDPDGGPVVLQQALSAGAELTWTLSVDSSNENSISYSSTDTRAKGILSNDTYRLPLYKHAQHPDMGSCADIVAIAYAGSSPAVDADVPTLPFEDTFESKYGSQSADAEGELGEIKPDGKAIADGSGGYVEVDLNTLRASRINRTQDHANYAQVTFTPTPGGMGRAMGSGEDVFYYKVVVFAEDNLYLYSDYDEIDASEGVEMYTYFTMKPGKKTDDIINPPDEHDPTQDTSNIDTTAPVKLGAKTPKTGDENNLVLWFGLMILAMGTIGVGISKLKKRD